MLKKIQEGETETGTDKGDFRQMLHLEHQNALDIKLSDLARTKLIINYLAGRDWVIKNIGNYPEENFNDPDSNIRNALNE